MKTRRSSTLLLSGLLLFGGMSTATASPAVSESVSAEQSPITMSEGATTAPDAKDQQALEKLNSLKGKQSKAQIKKILNSGQPADVLYDPETNEYLAAYHTEPVITPFLSIVGPGCTSSSACLRNTNNTPFGLEGTGSLTVNLSNITKVSAGNYNTGIYRTNGTGVITRAWNTTYLSSATYVRSVTRTP
ncbi:hypothetical protein [Kocuria sp. SM24M-10]|uniref:hypothetical protein n=1 Tax=Kocuria sp. SM24M-10 TaxID=1660349 RepID=UPI00128E2B26|nr:hypothetical protein [Kocuria sp. SM24M-10]